MFRSYALTNYSRYTGSEHQLACIQSGDVENDLYEDAQIASYFFLNLKCGHTPLRAKKGKT